MHQDTRDALDFLAEALGANNDSDTAEAVAVFDALPSVARYRRKVAQDALRAAAAQRAVVGRQAIEDAAVEVAREDAEALAQQRRTRQQSSRIGRSVPNEDGHQIGDVVYFNRRTAKYLAGLPVTVVGTNAASVNVKVPDDALYRRFAGQEAVRCPNRIVSTLPNA